MSVKIYRTVNRRIANPAGWGEGPWQAEPDKIQYVDPSTGLPCLIIRAPSSGALCGYVGTYPGHRWHSMDWGDYPWEDSPLAHGGINYTDFCAEWAPEEMGVCHVPARGGPGPIWWLGYDCGHVATRDRAPGTEALMKYFKVPHSFMTENAFGHPLTYKTVGYVMAVNASLAQQIMDAAPRAILP